MTTAYRGEVAIEHDHYLIGSPDDTTGELDGALVETIGEPLWVEVTFGYEEPARDHRPPDGVDVNEVEVHADASLMAWDYSSPQPESPSLLGPGRWRLAVTRRVVGAGDSESHRITASPLNAAASEWLHGLGTGHERAQRPPPPVDDEQSYDLRPSKGNWKLVAPSYPDEVGRWTAVSLSDEGITLTQPGGATWDVWITSAPYPRRASRWNAVASWRTGPGSVSLVSGAGRDIRGAPSPLVTASSMVITIAEPTIDDERRAMVAAGLRNSHDLQIYIQVV